MADIDAIRSRALSELGAASTSESLDAWRIDYLGRQGAVTMLLRGLGELPPDERRSAGAAANTLRAELEAALEVRRKEVDQTAFEQLESGAIDVSLPGRHGLVGRLHPITQTVRDVLASLGAMGFQVAEGPEVELEYYNFDALRIPEHHPSRDTQDTFWVNHTAGDRRVLLRTQTSPNQIRFMETHQPPIRVAVPGRVYRYEATDATHEWMFSQIELLAVDEGITMAHMKGTLTQLAQALFGRDRAVRFRCHYFPFVEPGAEVDIQCDLCGGAGCRSCGNEGWLEICGAGMVHREIIENVGYDADRYTGFAAGFGVERIAMLRHGIDDIRHFYANDLRFLRQF
ncbi:MAG TPA: phenylalanine--tRNA ligase subunit alpha [Dehalococcoidia bacterium]|nr:phenylalanine--tRNA ligase subunit alpha [Dehalococcoidia bacterium]